MRTVFIGLSAFFTVTCAVPYLRAVIQGTAKPKIMSWFTWTILTTIATVAAFSDKQYPSAFLTLAATVKHF